MNDKCANKGVVCEVTNCHYHTTTNECTAEKIEVCNCKTCNNGSNETFCSTYREKNID